MRAHSDFATFVSEYDATLRRHLQATMPAFRNDVEDILQESLVRIWEQFERWPDDPDQQLRFSHELIRNASVDLMRTRWGRQGQRRNREIPVNVTAIDGEVERYEAGHGRELIEEIRHQLTTMHAELDGDDDLEFERRWAALNAMLPALKPIEREVLFGHHPSGDDCKSTEVAKRLGITHGQARAHYSEAMAVLRPLLRHALAPDLDADEAAAVLDYSSGVMTNKRDRGRMKRHLEHCQQCRALFDAERAVVSTGAKLILPLPAILGVKAAATGAAAVAGGGAVVVGVELGSTAGLGSAGASLLGGATAKVLATATAGALAAGGWAVTHPDKPRDRQRQKPQSVAATATPATELIVAPAATATPRPPVGVRTSLAAARQREADRRRRRAQRTRVERSRDRTLAQATVTAAPTPDTPLAIPTAAPPTQAPPIPTAAPPTTGIPRAEPPEDKANSDFTREFSP